MNLTLILGVLAGMCVVWFVVTTLLIYDNLRRRGQKVSFLWLRLMAPWYASRYRQITKSETGRVGSLFYHWVVSINATLVFALSAILTRYL